MFPKGCTSKPEGWGIKIGRLLFLVIYFCFMVLTTLERLSGEKKQQQRREVAINVLSELDGA